MLNHRNLGRLSSLRNAPVVALPDHISFQENLDSLMCQKKAFTIWQNVSGATHSVQFQLQQQRTGTISNFRPDSWTRGSAYLKVLLANCPGRSRNGFFSSREAACRTF